MTLVRALDTVSRRKGWRGTLDNWLGLRPDGKEISIDHSKLMDWATRHDKQITVGWSHFFTDDKGNRLVRGPKMIQEARAQGWDDLAKKLEEYGFEDEEG